MTNPTTLALLTALATPSPAPPENGALLLARPLDGVAIDGDLSDWPDEVQRHAIALSHLDAPQGDADFRADLRVGYDADQGLLFVAVEVTDDDHRVDLPGHDWTELDACMLHVDGDHDPRGSGAVAYVLSGQRRELHGTLGAWDPKVAAASWDDVLAATRRSGSTTSYEFMIHLGPAVRPGRSLGLDVSLVDMDAGDDRARGGWMTWGRFRAKGLRSARCGDVLLVEERAPLGTLTGTTYWEEGLEGVPGRPDRVRVTSASDPELWVQAPLDEAGHYALRLPPGSYRVSCPFSTWGDTLGPHLVVARDVLASAQVEADATTRAPDLVLRTEPAPELFGETGLLFDYDDTRRAELEAFVEAWRAHLCIPGLSLALVKDGRIAFHGTFGVRNAYTREPVTAETLFEACSISKIVFAFACNRLVERGLLDLDRPLVEVLPFPELGHDPRHRRITARHVLTHRTGLPNWRRGELELEFDPGTAFGYSGEGFEYLGRCVARLCGTSLERVLEREVLEPLGFGARTHFADSDALRAVVAHGHDIDRPFAARPPLDLAVAHSIHTEARDFAHFMLALLERRGLSPASYDEMLRSQSPQPPLESTWGVPWKRSYGLGFALRDTPYGQAFGHGGSNGDFHCLLEAYPEHGVGFVAFGNNERAWAFTEVLRRYLISGRLED